MPSTAWTQQQFARHVADTLAEPWPLRSGWVEQPGTRQPEFILPVSGNGARTWSAQAAGAAALKQQALLARESARTQSERAAAAFQHGPVLRQFIQDGNVRGALVYLNASTAYRFSAVYRFDGDMLFSVFFYDRTRPTVETVPPVPLLSSYCALVREKARAVVIMDAMRDASLTGGGGRSRIHAFCGVPLTDAQGTMIGSVCHFDVDPVTPHEADVELLENFAPLIQAL